MKVKITKVSGSGIFKKEITVDIEYEDNMAVVDNTPYDDYKLYLLLYQIGMIESMPEFVSDKP